MTEEESMREKQEKVRLERTVGINNLCLGAIGTLCLGAILAGTVSLIASGGKVEVPTRDKHLPVPRGNQILVLHPDYKIRGFSSMGYTLLTDMDYDGTWDVAEKVDAKIPFGNYASAQRKLYFRQGFGPAQSVEGVEMKIVDDTFFEVVER